MILKRLLVLGLILCFGVSINAQYTLTSTDLTVSAEGIITDCSYDFASTDIVIPDEVDGITITGIADVDLFGSVKIFCQKGITSVVLPSGIKTIGEYVFRGNDLTSVVLPDGMESIGLGSFGGNDFAFTHVDIPNSVTFIGKYAFSMNAFDNITLPTPLVSGFICWIDNDGNEYAGGTVVEYDGAEYRAKIVYTLQDEDVEMSEEGLITTCSYDFRYTDIIIPETLDGITVTGVEDKSWTGVFDDKGITSLQLPETFLHIGNYAFSDNDLTSLTIPGSVSFIGTSAFSSNDLTEIILPNSVTYIGQQAFWSIDSIVLPTPTNEGYEHWISSSGDIYLGGEKVKPAYDWFEAKIVYTLTDADVRMVNGVIDSCLYDFSRKYIKIPDSLNNQRVTGIANGKEIYYGYYVGVFSNKKIKEIQLPAYLNSIGDYAFYENKLDSLIILPDSVEYIGLDAFTLNSPFNGIVLPAPEKENLVCESWLDNYDYVYEPGDTIKNFYERTYSAQYTYQPGTSVIAVSGELCFEDVEVNSQESLVLTIRNNGNSSFTVSDIELTEGFSVDWTGGEVLADDYHEVNITFLPTEEKEYSGTINVVSNATLGTSSIAVTGTTIPQKTSVITLTGTLSFEDVEVNSQESLVLTISNDGNSSFTVSDIELPAGFSSDWTSGEIAAEDYQEVNITFSPTEEKEYSGTINVISDAISGTNTLAVSGSTIPQKSSIISLSGTLNFKDVDINSEESMVLTIRNDGNTSFTVSNIELPVDFSSDWISGEIAAESNQTVNITFAPSEEKEYSGVITVLSDALSGINTIAASGTGISPLTSLEDLSNSVNFKIYPNPASNYITLPLGTEYSDLEILNLKGAIVFKEQVQSNTINISSLEKGMYVLRITKDNTILQTKFTKQ